ncbi:MAG TPA: RNA polymerase sigma-70 factor [Chitinophagaceae bacterium]|nr:RNA polymerase sigma-70 factor [Chitinophagaceae bacterium]
MASGNAGAFDQLYRQLYPALYLLAFKMVKSGDMAKDIVSDVFLQVWEGRSRLHQIQNVKAYLYVSAKNKALNYLKTKKLSAGEPVESVLNSGEPSDAGFFQALLEAEMARALAEAVNKLPPECKKVIELVLKGYSTNDIAGMLEISASAVSHQKSRAVRLLKEKIYWAFLLGLPIALSSS